MICLIFQIHVLGFDYEKGDFLMSNIVKFPIEKSTKEIITENRAKRIAETACLELEIEELKRQVEAFKNTDVRD